MDIFWIIDMIIPAIIILIGFLYKYRAPKDINKFHGYRTNQSMKSQEAWDYAHNCGANIWIIIGLFLVIVVCLNKIFIKIRPEYLSLINLLISIIGMIIPIPVIDSKIKKKFIDK
ncbi:SdpI family protein [Clostridioides sp. ZZV14-6154]|uniref:SdpI family protein n=1 Tax=Clostridioides sp. ZZV14-6154 TaxID=2811495 RepID=UPI001D12C7BB|nr:SdpI family protein [Clostridioides sp. ZZV14-6154]